MALDLLLSKHSATNFVAVICRALILIHSSSPYTYVIEVFKFTLKHLQQKTHILSSAYHLTPTICIADRQTPFNAFQLKQFMASLGCSLKLSSRERHGESNGVVERSHWVHTPQVPRYFVSAALVSAALVSAAVDHTFWYFAMAHAVYVKNGTYHSAIQRTPHYLQRGFLPDAHTL